MGLFGKLLGGERVRKSPPVMPVQEVPQPKPVGIKGEIPQTSFRPEADESPRTLKFQQVKYGKIVQYADGPIRGDDHHLTGKSPDFNLNLPYDLHGRDVFDNQARNSPNNYNNPWQKQGAIEKKIVEVGGKQYVVVALHRKKNENGENGVPGRMFDEQHAMAIPAEEWSVAVVPQILNVLDAKSLTDENPSLPEIEIKTDILDQPLPDQWLDEYTRGVIANVISGKPIDIQDWDTNGRDFLQKIYRCLICLPENIARQISFGVGFPDQEDDSVRIIQTMSAKRGIKKIADTWRHNTPEDIAFGQKYLTELVQLIGDARTPRQVMAAIQKMSPGLKAEVEKRFNQK